MEFIEELGKPNADGEITHFKKRDKKGRIVMCEALFTFQYEVNGKHYIVYTDNSRDKKGRIRISASSFEPDKPIIALPGLKTQEEQRMIKKLLDKLWKEAHTNDEE